MIYKLYNIKRYKRVSELTVRSLSLDFFPRLRIIVFPNSAFTTFSDVFRHHGHKIHIFPTFLFNARPNISLTTHRHCICVYNIYRHIQCRPLFK